MHVPVPLNYLGWLLALVGPGIGYLNDHIQEPLLPTPDEWEWGKEKETIHADFKRRRFAIWKHFRSTIGTSISIAGVALTATLAFPENSLVVVGASLASALLTGWITYNVLRGALELCDLGDREKWALHYELGLPFKYTALNAKGCFLNAFNAFAQRHPKEHRRLVRTLLTEYDAAQRVHDREIDAHVEGMKLLA